MPFVPFVASLFLVVIRILRCAIFGGKDGYLRVTVRSAGEASSVGMAGSSDSWREGTPRLCPIIQYIFRCHIKGG